MNVEIQIEKINYKVKIGKDRSSFKYQKEDIEFSYDN